jgi:hypothetical protein
MKCINTHQQTDSVREVYPDSTAPKGMHSLKNIMFNKNEEDLIPFLQVTKFLTRKNSLK